MGCGCKKRNQEAPAQPAPATIRLTEVMTPVPTSIPVAPSSPSTPNQ
jgi:hypothetical protein